MLLQLAFLLQAHALRAPHTYGARLAPRHATLDSVVTGCGASRPSTRLSNEEISSVVDTSDEWIATRTGIRARRLLQPEESLADHAATAGKIALRRSGCRPEDVGLVIVATSTPEDMFGDAPNVAQQCGCHNAVAFDMTAACSGFLFALITAAQGITAGSYEAALVVGADALSRWVDWDDRNTCILFGDGAGAVVLEKGSQGLLGFALKSDGAGREKLALPYAGAARTLVYGKRVTLPVGRPMVMAGRDVYVFATRKVPEVLEAALADAQLTVQDVDWFLLHQANVRILESVASRLGVDMAKVLVDLDESGNTSAASIPLALDAALSRGQVKPGQVIACAGFGAGLSWGAAIFRCGGDAVRAS